jgi:GST-like protein
MGVDVHTWEPNANSGKPLLGLREKGVEFTHHYVDMGKREHHGPAYLKINPGGTIPTVIHDDFKMTESTPSLEYINEAFNEPNLIPVDPFAAWQMRWWCRYLDRSICPALAMVASTAFAGPMLVDQVEAEREAALKAVPLPERRRTWEFLYRNATPKKEIEESQRRISAAIARMEKTLSEHPYLAGDTYSLADLVAMISIYSWPLRDDVSAEKTPHLWDWFKRCHSRPAVRACFDDAGPMIADRASKARAQLGLAE